MKNRWGKGEPVNLSDLLKITPVANEILHLSEELNMSTNNVMWIVSQIVDNNDEIDEDPFFKGLLEEEDILDEEEWEDLDLDNMEEEMEQSNYQVNVKINGATRFPEIGFKAGVNDKEDLNYFFEMVIEMLEKLE
ncbi:MAG: hypothetical protein U9N81_10475 [Bacillota bacterium]|nr:hypothetical protein [Bacillota bacterium]